MDSGMICSTCGGFGEGGREGGGREGGREGGGREGGR